MRASARRWMRPGDRIVQVREGLTATLVHVVHARARPAAVRSARDQRLLDVGQRLRRAPLHEAVRRAAAALHPRIAARAGRRLRHRQHRRGADRRPRARAASTSSTSRATSSSSSRTHAHRVGQHPLDDPRVHVHIEDGRYFLQTTSRALRPDHRRAAAAGDGRRREPVHARVLRARARAPARGGIASYWLPMMNIAPRTAQVARSRAFCDAFDDCSLWHGVGAQLHVDRHARRGARAPVDDERFARAFARSGLARRARRSASSCRRSSARCSSATPTYLRELDRGSEPLTDDWPKRMHHAGTREERDALIWQWRDTSAARARFATSELIARLWPPACASEALRQFENQRLINDLLFPDADHRCARRGCCTRCCTARRCAFRSCCCSAAIPTSSARLRGCAPEVASDRVAAPSPGAARSPTATSPRALALLDRMPDEQLALPDLRQYVHYVVTRQGTQAERSRNRSAVRPHSLKPDRGP